MPSSLDTGRGAYLAKGKLQEKNLYLKFSGIMRNDTKNRTKHASMQMKSVLHRTALSLECKLSVLVIFLRCQACTLACLLPSLNLTPCPFTLSLQLVVTCAQLGDGLLCEQLLQGPFLDVLVLVLLELSDELDCALQDGAFVLLASRYNLGKLVDTLIDSFTSATLD